MTQDQDSHISIAMPDGTTCRAFIDFTIYPDLLYGDIVRLEYEALGSLFLIVSAHKDPNGKAAKILAEMTDKVRQSEVLTNLPHSPARTQMRSTRSL
jgi:hypothetical protein